MLRSAIIFSTAALLLFFIPMALIRAQPYESHDLGMLLTKREGCAVPCFMGIVPGSTIASKAIRRLQDSEWVSWVSVERTDLGTLLSARWRWKATVPPPLVPGDVGTLYFEESDVPGHVFVSKMTMRTSLSVGDAYLQLGQPDTLVSNALKGIPDAFVGVVYQGGLLSVWSVVPCPVSNMTFWQSPMIVDFNNIFGILPTASNNARRGFYC